MSWCRVMCIADVTVTLASSDETFLATLDRTLVCWMSLVLVAAVDVTHVLIEVILVHESGSAFLTRVRMNFCGFLCFRTMDPFYVSDHVALPLELIPTYLTYVGKFGWVGRFRMLMGVDLKCEAHRTELAFVRMS